MKTATIGRILTYWLTLFGLSFSLQAMNPLCFEPVADVPLDSRATVGRLDNGLVYFILPNREPPGRASLRLIVGAGSLMESDRERGLAHYLEHIAFCGSRHFSQGDLIESLQRMGIKFGRHSNAYTSFAETVYKLDLPDCRRETLIRGLEVMCDFLTELNLDDREIDRERGVILSEKLAQDSVNYRHFLAQTEFLYPRSILPARLPIGEEETIRSIDGATMRRFYGRFYGPNNAALLIVGDLDLDLARDLIRSALGSARPLGNLPAIDLGDLDLSGTEFLVHRDREMAQSNVEIFCLESGPIDDGQSFRREQLLTDLTGLMLTRRLEKVSHREGSPLVDGGAGFDFDGRRGLRLGWLAVTCEHDRVLPAVRIAEQELRRAIDYGFTEAEIGRASAILLNRLENELRMEPTRRNDWLADAWVASLVNCRLPTSARWDLDFAKATLAGLDRETINDLFRRLWRPHNRRIMVSGNLPRRCTEGAIGRVYRRSREELLKAPENEDLGDFDYDFHGASPVLSRRMLRRMPVLCYQLANGVRLNLLPTDFEKGQILVRLRFGRGAGSETEATYGLHHFATYGFLEGGLGKYSWETIRDLLAGRSCSVDFDVTDDGFLLSGRTTARDLPTELTLLAAYLMDPGFRREGEREAQKAIFQLHTTIEHTPEGIWASLADRFLHAGDRRYGYESFDRLKSFTMEDLRPWMEAALRDDPVEISLVGDFDPQVALAELVRAFGSLPARLDRLAVRPHLDMPRGQVADFSFESQIPKALVQLVLPTDGHADLEEKWRCDLLADLIGDRARIKLRKEMGETYSPHGYNYASRTIDGYGHIGIRALVEPKKVDDLAFVLGQIIDDIRTNGIGEDEFRRIRDPFLSQLKDNFRRNGFWLSLIDGLQSDPQRVEEIERLGAEFFESLTPADLEKSLARLRTEDRILIRIKPTSPGKK